VKIHLLKTYEAGNGEVILTTACGIDGGHPVYRAIKDPDPVDCLNCRHTEIYKETLSRKRQHGMHNHVFDEFGLCFECDKQK
jgi:hypothetical protein